MSYVLYEVLFQLFQLVKFYYFYLQSRLFYLVASTRNKIIKISQLILAGKSFRKKLHENKNSLRNYNLTLIKYTEIISKWEIFFINIKCTFLEHFTYLQ